MLQALLFAPYIALASSMALAVTVVAICCNQPQPLAGEGFALRMRKKNDARKAAQATSTLAGGSRPARKKFQMAVA